MNANAFNVLIYMIIHLLIFLINNVFLKFANKIFSCCFSNRELYKRMELLKKEVDIKKDEIREISATSEFVKYTKMNKEIDKLENEIKRIEAELIGKNFNQNLAIINDKDVSCCQKFINFLENSYILKYMIFGVHIIEYLSLKNQYLEVDNNLNANNIIVHYFFKEEDNKYFALIPVYRILICETIILTFIYNLILKHYS